MTEQSSHYNQRPVERIAPKPLNDQHDYTYILLASMVAILAVSIMWLAVSYILSPKLSEFKEAMKEEAKQTRLEINQMKDTIKQDLMIELGLIQKKLNLSATT